MWAVGGQRAPGKTFPMAINLPPHSTEQHQGWDGQLHPHSIPVPISIPSPSPSPSHPILFHPIPCYSILFHLIPSPPLLTITVWGSPLTRRRGGPFTLI